jgi:hypothetical protein
MEARARPMALLRRPLRANGVELATDDASIQDLDDWFCVNVEEDPESSGRLLPDWCSVVNALYGRRDDRAPSPSALAVLYVESKNAAFQRHVIMEFGAEAPKSPTNLDIDWAVTVCGHRIIAGQDVEVGAFWRWLKNVEPRA